MMKIIDVGADAVLEAINEFDTVWRDSTEYSGWEQNRNYLHAIIVNGRLYPPKMIISLATGMPTNTFYGGEPANSYLRARGFKVIQLRQKGKNDTGGDGPHVEQINDIESEGSNVFDPSGQEDARERSLRSVVERRGQSKFRKKLIQSFHGRCAITGCEVLPILEAAHITPYLGPATNDVSNGLLLRADIHTLWDLGLIAINPEKLTVWVSLTITDPTYRQLDGESLHMPPSAHLCPSIEALRAQWAIARRDETE
ncbi:HNH endonuclease [Pseudoduganella lutea]|uniref:HNH endonuclease n=2 Tax=Pseudoduganella lutea TaxID=321985 RepID=A0A4P6L8P8_9BURK|nr:HNH endonuclease [Pseudoduganella lutea]